MSKIKRTIIIILIVTVVFAGYYFIFYPRTLGEAIAFRIINTDKVLIINGRTLGRYELEDTRELLRLFGKAKIVGKEKTEMADGFTRMISFEKKDESFFGITVGSNDEFLIHDGDGCCIVYHVDQEVSDEIRKLIGYPE